MKDFFLEKTSLNLIKGKITVEEILKQLILGQTITIRFLNITEYIERTGMIIKIDKINNILYLPNLKIPFDNIIAIKS